MVKMNCLDFLSTFPRFYIFQEKRNQTNFGGVLFLIYIIIMIILSLTYILDFALNPKYEIEASTIFINKNEKNNSPPDPEVDLEIIINYFNDSNFSDSLFFKEKNSKIQHYGSYEESKILIYRVKRKVSELNELELYYFTNESYYSKDYNRPFLYSINLTSKQIIVENYGTIPLKNGETYNDPIEIELYYHQNYFELFSHWISVVYNEKQGISRLFNELFDFKTNYISGYLNNFDSHHDITEFPYKKDFCPNSSTQACLLLGKIIIKQTEYLEYRRKKINFTDVLSTIGALFSTFNFIFSFINRYYSFNFDNYKIIQKIFENKYSNKINVETNKEIKIIKNELYDIEENKTPLISPLNQKDKEKNELENQNSINDIDSVKENLEDVKSENYLNLPKLSFFDFLFANIYCKCCKKIRKQEIIKECNKIIANYSSIDKILFNIIELENLFMDYKWNNPKITKLKKNDLLKDLINLIN